MNKNIGWLFIFIFIISGCVHRPPKTAQIPPSFITYDEQGRVLEIVEYNADHTVNTQIKYQYADDEINVETITRYNGTNGWVESRIFNIPENSIALKTISEYDANGNLLDEKSVLINPGSHPFRLRNYPASK